MRAACVLRYIIVSVLVLPSPSPPPGAYAWAMLLQAGKCPKINYLLQKTHSSAEWTKYMASLDSFKKHLCEVAGIPVSQFSGFSDYFDGFAVCLCLRPPQRESLPHALSLHIRSG